MRKIINDPDNIVEEMMEGFIAAYHHMYYKHPEVNSVISRCRRKNKVSLIIGGGSGHEPMFSGFVGAGLADAACCGNIFASPDPKNIYETGKSIDEGKGILFVYGCYAGDNLNFDMGEEFPECQRNQDRTCACTGRCGECTKGAKGRPKRHRR